MATSELYNTAMKIIDGYNSWDLDAILARRTEDCTQQIYPTRLNRPAMDNAAYREYFSAVLPWFKNFHLQVLDVVEDARRHKVVLHIQGTAQTALGDYANEYMIVVETTEDDRRVRHIKEFVDSGYSVDYFQRLRAHHAEGR